MKKISITFLSLLIIGNTVFICVGLFLFFGMKVEDIQVYLNILQFLVVVCGIIFAYLNYEELVRKNYKSEEILIKCVSEKILRDHSELLIIGRSTKIDTIGRIEVEIQNFGNTHIYFKQADLKIIEKGNVKKTYYDIGNSNSNMYFKGEKININLELPINDLLKNIEDLSMEKNSQRFKNQFLELKYNIQFYNTDSMKSLILIYKNTLIYHNDDIPEYSIEFEKQII